MKKLLWLFCLIPSISCAAIKVSIPTSTVFSTTITANGGIIVGGGSSLISSTQPAGITIQTNSGIGAVIYTSSFTFNGSTFVVQGANVGIGISAPTQVLTIGGGVSAQNTLLLASSGSATAQMAMGCNASGGLSGGYCIDGTPSGVTAPREFQMNGSIVANMNSGGQMLLGGSTAAGSFVRLDVSTGTFGLPRYTSGQTILLTPAQVGLVIFNTTINLPCYSTSTAINGWSRFTGTTNCS